MGNTLCGSVVVIAIPNAHTQDDATDSLSLRSFYGKNLMFNVPTGLRLMMSSRMYNRTSTTTQRQLRILQYCHTLWTLL